ncbi:MAG: hypothetical protein IJO45_05115 [Oscillospiraceae bacterium]|nr:hypothetical protein [Oscillospiraceae bacterium]
MHYLSFTTTGCWDQAEGFGCASLGLPGLCDNFENRVRNYKSALESIMITGSYEDILFNAREAVSQQDVYAAIVVFGNAGGENTFLEALQKIVTCPMVGGGAAIDGATGRSGLIPGAGQAAVLLITDDRFTYEAKTECIHSDILEECTVKASDPRTLLTINGIAASQYLQNKKAELGLSQTDFEHLTLSDMRNVNAHLSCVDGVIKSGRDVTEKMLLRYVPQDAVYEKMYRFYNDPDAIVFGCAGLSGLLDRPLQTPSLGLFLFGEVCTVDGVAEFGNLMLSKLVIRSK